MSSLSTDRSAITAPWRIGVDVGGTFTDLVLGRCQGALRVGKVPSTAGRSQRRASSTPSKRRPANCRCRAPSCSAAAAISCTARRSRPTSSSSAAGATVGMLVTRGFRDSLEIRRGIRKNAWDHRTPFPPPLVPRYLRLARRRTASIAAERSSSRCCTDDIRAAVRHLPRRGRELDRDLPLQQLPRRSPRARRRRRSWSRNTRRLGHAVKRGHADHGRI